MAKDYYAVLGVSRTADDVVVHAAWKALLRKYHPDANADATAQARAREINEAFAVLGKQPSRAAYDRSRSAPPPPRSSSSGQSSSGTSSYAQSSSNASSARHGAPPYGSAYRPSQSQHRSPSYAARRPGGFSRTMAALLLIAAVPTAVVALNRYPDALPELGDRISSYGDVRIPTITAGAAVGDDQAEVSDNAAPPPVDPAVVTAAVGRAVKVMRQGGVSAAAKIGSRCDGNLRDWRLLDYCIAFDVAVSLVEATTPQALSPPNAYFMLTAQRDALRAEQLDHDPIRVDKRISSIRALVVPQVTTALIAQPPLETTSQAEPGSNSQGAAAALSTR